MRTILKSLCAIASEYTRILKLYFPEDGAEERKWICLK